MLFTLANARAPPVNYKIEREAGEKGCAPWERNFIISRCYASLIKLAATPRGSVGAHFLCFHCQL